MELDATTVIFEVVNFVVLAALLTRFLFRPVRKVLRERKEAVERAGREAESARAASEAAQREFDARRRELEAAAAAEREAARAAGEAAARQLVDDARSEMRRARAALDADLSRARAEAIERLTPELVALGVEATRRVISEMGAKDVAVAFARTAAVQLARELAQTGEEGSIEARVSPDADVYAVSLALDEHLGDRKVRVVVDPSLCAGVKLLVGGLEIEASAGASLSAWLREPAAGPPLAVAEVEAAPA
ncbi:MAG: hypothetical protein B7733_05545 [Myxococcales bacterium FL481]|nr:MAG: hypothetical protein B7733_05545 [Myxococcales bacterium FL481]